jgi:O-antigen/teichoic acid export membrane protein
VLRHMTKGSALLLLGLIETGMPFIRMLLLSHALSLTELGFVSALAATIGAFEQISDFALYRYVFSAAREQYASALAAAHGLAILRGLTLGGLLALAAPLVARVFSLEGHVFDFVLLGPAVAFRGFDHLAPRVFERDYRYGPQLMAAGASYGLSLGVLAVAVRVIPTHVAFLISLYVQVIAQVTMDHIVAGEKYRFAIFTPDFYRAFRFGYPLVFNGAGLALSSQGDRFLVGALLGLPELAVYSIATLSTSVPSTLIGRVTSTMTLAQLYNASQRDDGRYAARLRLFARLLPLIAAFFSLGVVALLNIGMPLVFGAKFVLSPASTGLLALAGFFRLVRGEPFTSMLLNRGRTKRLAIANLASTSTLLFMLVLLLIFQRFEAVMAGRLLGELTATAVMLFLTRDLFRPARLDFIKAVAVGLLVLVGAIALGSAGVGVALIPSIAMVAAGLAVFVAWTLYSAPGLLDASFSAIRLKT